MAHTGAPTSSSGRDSRVPTISSATGEAATPARNSRESPGKKNPMSSPVSANMMNSTPTGPRFSMSHLGLIRSLTRKGQRLSRAWSFSMGFTTPKTYR